MKAYNELVRELDSDGAHYSQDLSEVDVSDPEDVKILVNDPSGEVLVHLGSGNYLDRYKIYRAHVQEWRQQFEKLESVDLRYDRQIIVNPDLRGAPKPAPISANAAKAAVAAGVPAVALTAAALVQHHKEEAKTKAVAAKKPVHTAKVVAKSKAAPHKAVHAKAARQAAKAVAKMHTKAPTAATTVKPASAKPASPKPAATVYGPPPPRQVQNGSRGKPRPGVPKD
jgi:cell division protein FtsQ